MEASYAMCPWGFTSLVPFSGAFSLVPRLKDGGIALFFRKCGLVSCTALQLCIVHSGNRDALDSATNWNIFGDIGEGITSLAL